VSGAGAKKKAPRRKKKPAKKPGKPRERPIRLAEPLEFEVALRGLLAVKKVGPR
jgi:hypothetical protein